MVRWRSRFNIIILKRRIKRRSRFNIIIFKNLMHIISFNIEISAFHIKIIQPMQLTNSYYYISYWSNLRCILINYPNLMKKRGSKIIFEFYIWQKDQYFFCYSDTDIYMNESEGMHWKEWGHILIKNYILIDFKYSLNIY
jgi:hypothetical protein